METILDELNSKFETLSTGSTTENTTGSTTPKKIIDTEYFKKLINSNKYVINCVSNKEKDIHSLSYLIDSKLSQSDCIKLGTGMEKILSDLIIVNSTNLENIKPKNEKGKKEKDHLFKDENLKIIYYAEIKSNLNLDTEKCKSTSEKCSLLAKELQEEYPDYKIQMYLIGIRYYTKSLIPKIILDKYSSIKENVLGVNEYLEQMNIQYKFETENDYKQILNHLAKQMFESE